MRHWLISLALCALLLGAPLFSCAKNMATAVSLAQKTLLISAISLDKATKKIRKETGGKIVESKKIIRKGRPTYRIKVLINGKVKVFFVDPEKG